MAGWSTPFILARRSGKRSGCLILSSTERFSPLSALEDMLRDVAGGSEERKGRAKKTEGPGGVSKSRFKIQGLDLTEAECR